MKTALIAGICLLALTFAIADALDKKQDISDDCPVIPSGDAQDCFDAGERGDLATACSANCMSAVKEYFGKCFVGESLDQVNQGYDRTCSAAGMTVALFTLVSAVLVAVGN